MSDELTHALKLADVVLEKAFDPDADICVLARQLTRLRERNAELEKELESMREALAQFMIRHSFATGHGDTHAGLLAELEAQMPMPRPAAAWLALREVAAERQRQIEQEGWSPEHDDDHVRGEMASAAASYAVYGLEGGEAIAIGIWPWSADWWKPKDRRRDLVRAGALIIAEIERLDRAAIRSLKRLK